MLNLGQEQENREETNKNSGDDGRLFQRVLLGKCVGKTKISLLR